MEFRNLVLWLVTIDSEFVKASSSNLGSPVAYRDLSDVWPQRWQQASRMSGRWVHWTELNWKQLNLFNWNKNQRCISKQNPVSSLSFELFGTKQQQQQQQQRNNRLLRRLDPWDFTNRKKSSLKLDWAVCNRKMQRVFNTGHEETFFFFFFIFLVCHYFVYRPLNLLCTTKTSTVKTCRDWTVIWSHCDTRACITEWQ